MFRRVLLASSTAPCAASSQLFGDCDISSMTLTTLATVVHSPSSIYRSRAQLARFSSRCTAAAFVRHNKPLLDLFPEPAAIWNVRENELALVESERIGAVVATER